MNTPIDMQHSVSVRLKRREQNFEKVKKGAALENFLNWLKPKGGDFQGGSYVAEHGNWPIFSTEFGKLYVFWQISENRNIVRHGNLIF